MGVQYYKFQLKVICDLLWTLKAQGTENMKSNTLCRSAHGRYKVHYSATTLLELSEEKLMYNSFPEHLDLSFPKTASIQTVVSLADFS